MYSYNTVAHHPSVVVLEVRGLVLNSLLYLLVALPLAPQLETATFCRQATLHKLIQIYDLVINTVFPRNLAAAGFYFKVLYHAEIRGLPMTRSLYLHP